MIKMDKDTLTVLDKFLAGFYVSVICLNFKIACQKIPHIKKAPYSFLKSRKHVSDLKSCELIFC